MNTTRERKSRLLASGDIDVSFKQGAAAVKHLQPIVQGVQHMDAPVRSHIHVRPQGFPLCAVERNLGLAAHGVQRQEQQSGGHGRVGRAVGPDLQQHDLPPNGVESGGVVVVQGPALLLEVDERSLPDGVEVQAGDADPMADALRDALGVGDDR